MQNPSPFRKEVQLSGGEDVKLFGGGDGAPCETGNAASSNSANTLSQCKRWKTPTLQSRSEPRQEVRAGPVNQRAHLISSRSDRGSHGEGPPTIAIWKEDGLAVRNAGARIGRSHPRKCRRSMALADRPRPNASAYKQHGREEAED